MKTASITTRVQLQRVALRYRKSLLPKWKIRFEFAGQEELGTSPDYFYFGDAKDIDLQNSRAIVRVARSYDLQKARPAENLPRLIRRTVVHELLHVLLDPSQRISEDALFETGLDHLAAIIVP